MNRYFPRDYTLEERALLARVMYFRHDVEYLLNIKKPGLCKAGFRSLFVNPTGDVFPCAMGAYPESKGNLAESPEVTLRPGPGNCPFAACQCETENMNAVQFEDLFEFSAFNQNKYVYRFRDDAIADPNREEWSIPC